MLPFLNTLIFGDNVGLKHGDLKNMVTRHSFSDYLNFVAYDPDTEAYLNQDNTIGLLWECTPLSFAGLRTMKTLEGLFRAGLPMGSVLQFIFHADPWTDWGRY